MKAERKLIVVLIDGLSADYYEEHTTQLPYLSQLAAGGTRIRRLSSPVPATSMPGRASMLTGRPSQDHGVFGNHVFDGKTFRCATPGDIAVPTIAGRAREAGMAVANIGFAMAGPDSADVYRPPWWLRDFMEGSRFAKALDPASLPALFAAHHHGGHRSSEVEEEARASALPAGPEAELMLGLACDRRAIGVAADLACSDMPPDLILTEIAMTDQIQHRFGFATPAAHWALGMADMLIGYMMHRLERAGRLADYAVAVTSDHGHSPIETAINPSAVLPETLFQSEGATLHVAIRDRAHEKETERRLSEVGAEAIGNDHVPGRLRAQVSAFTAPPGHSFEEASTEGDPAPLRAPKYISSHGLRPGVPADDRFCIFAGAGVRAKLIQNATAEQFCPTLGAMLGIAETDGNSLPVV